MDKGHIPRLETRYIKQSIEPLYNLQPNLQTQGVKCIRNIIPSIVKLEDGFSGVEVSPSSGGDQHKWLGICVWSSIPNHLRCLS